MRRPRKHPLTKFYPRNWNRNWKQLKLLSFLLLYRQDLNKTYSNESMGILSWRESVHYSDGCVDPLNVDFFNEYFNGFEAQSLDLRLHDRLAPHQLLYLFVQVRHLLPATPLSPKHAHSLQLQSFSSLTTIPGGSVTHRRSLSLSLWIHSCCYRHRAFLSTVSNL